MVRRQLQRIRSGSQTPRRRVRRSAASDQVQAAGVKESPKYIGQVMPDPLSRVAPDAGIAIGNVGDRPWLRHRDLAVLAIEAIASWSNVEAFRLQLFIELFGGRGSLATDVYLCLLYTSDAADDLLCVDLGGRRII